MTTDKKYYLKCAECGEVAFFLRKKLNVGDEFLASDIIHKNNLQPGDNMTCQSCDLPLGHESLLTNLIYEYKE